jgi:hypothetical protein
VNFIEDTKKLNKNNSNLKEVKKMKRTMTLSFLALMVAALAFAFGHSAMAFHQADELVCMACHTMHASENGGPTGVIPANGFAAAPAGGVTPGGNPKLILQQGVTDLCLACHSEGGSASSFVDPSGDLPPHVMSSGGSAAVALPGGDYWSSNQSDPGVGGRGHNPYYTSATIKSAVIFEDENYGPPPDNPLNRTPPGGSTALTKWDCGSCHAPHHGDLSFAYGTAAAFRMLWSKPAGQGGSDVTFNALGANLTLDESNANHTAYIDNSSEWCAQCHTNFHETGGAWTIHPSGFGLPGYMQSVYNLVGYNYIIPVEDINATTGVFTPSAPFVTCMSCHRAHGAATNAILDTRHVDTRNITRWDNETASGADDGCNKCHSKGS